MNHHRTDILEKSFGLSSPVLMRNALFRAYFQKNPSDKSRDPSFERRGAMIAWSGQ